MWYLTSDPTDPAYLRRLGIQPVKGAKGRVPAAATRARVASDATDRGFHNAESSASRPGFVVKGLLRSAAQGATLGTADEMLAALRAHKESPALTMAKDTPSLAAKPGAYAAAVADERQQLQDFSHDMPGFATAAELGGGLLLPMAGAKAVGEGIKGAAETGALYGGIYGAGKAEGGPKARLLGAAKGAAKGAVTGAALGAAVKGLLRVPTPPSTANRVASKMEKAGESAIPATRGLPDAKGEWAVITAENPGGQTLTDAENTARMADFKKALDKAGYEYEPAIGRYYDTESKQVLDEHPFLIHGITPKAARALAKQFGQNGVLTPFGYHDLVNERLYPTKEFVPNATEMPYTEVNGLKFSLNTSPEDIADPFTVEQGDLTETARNAVEGGLNAENEQQQLARERSGRLRGLLGGASEAIRRRGRGLLGGE